MKPSFAAWLVGFCTAASAAHADEGLWTFDNFPAEKVRQAYGFAPDAAWLDHVRLASVRLPGCSAGIVSRHGLVATNHHCVLDCIKDLSAPGQDLNMTPVLAATQADERQCPGLEAEIVVAISDVTDALVKATTGLSGEAFQKARDAEIARHRGECGKGDAHGYCEVVSLYSGGKYALHKYRTYDDVRLVLGPEEAAGSFGGDPDNFAFPRYAFDIALIRLYEDGKPVETPEHFVWRSSPLTDGELLFISGNPGETGRLWAASTTDFLLDTYYPYTLVTGGGAARTDDHVCGARRRRGAHGRRRCSPTSRTATRATGANAQPLPRRRLPWRCGAAERDLRARVASDASACRRDRRSVERHRCARRCAARPVLSVPDAGIGGGRLLRIVRHGAHAGPLGRGTRQAGRRAAARLFRRRSRTDDQGAFPADAGRAGGRRDRAGVLAVQGARIPDHRRSAGQIAARPREPGRPGASAGRRHQARRCGRAPAPLRGRQRRDRPVRRSADRVRQKFDARRGHSARQFREKVREPKDAALERIARARFRLYGDTVYPDATGTCG